MSSGTYTVSIGSGEDASGNAASKTWSGSSTPRGQVRLPLPYTVNGYVNRHTRFNEYRETPYPYGPLAPTGYKAYMGWTGLWYNTISFMNSSQTSSVNLQCSLKMVDAVNSGDFSAGVFLAELPEAVSSVVGLSLSVLESLRLLAKRDVNGATRTLTRALSSRGHKGIKKSSKVGLKLDDISSTWLALQYAWKPLLSDIQSMMEKIEEMKKARSLTFKRRSSRTIIQKMIINSDCGWNQTYRRQNIWTLREHPSMAQTLGLTDPASVIWEKVPLSFVVDWFIPIGDYLKVMGFPPRLVNSYCNSSYNLVTSKEKNVNSSVYMRDGSWDIRRFDFVRSVGKDTNSIDFYGISYPPRKTLDRAFSLSHCENAAALIYGSIAETTEALFNVGSNPRSRRDLSKSRLSF